NAEQKLIATQTVHPRPVKLTEKGDYTIRVYVRHEDAKTLERLRDTVLTLEMPLSAPVTLPVYDTVASVFTSSVSQDRVDLDIGRIVPRYLGGLTAELVECPEDVQPVDRLAGDVTLQRHNGHAVLRLPLSIQVPPAATLALKPALKDVAPSVGPSDTTDTLEARLRDAKLAWATSATTDAAESARALDELLRDFPQHLPILLARLAQHDPNTDADPAQSVRDEEHAHAVLSAADAVVDAVDQHALAHGLFPATGAAAGDEEGKRQRADLEKQRATLITALASRTRALLALWSKVVHSGDAPTAAVSAARAKADSAYTEYATWRATTVPKNGTSFSTPDALRHLAIVVARERLSRRPGLALCALLAHLASTPLTKDTVAVHRALREQMAQTMEEAGWDWWAHDVRAKLAARQATA
ncbi:MAG TPA: tripeptidyl peptidase II, partial [Polyangiales bacterium]|nr:tripeptidyl peptidase II [Polyangiales bacterium]